MPAAALRQYELPGNSQLMFVRRGENETFRVEAGEAGRFALRLHRPGYQSPAAVRSELMWMSALREAGIETPAVIPGLDGQDVQEVALPGKGKRLAVLFEWIEGRPLQDLDRLELWERLGELMGTMHRHVRAWARPRAFTRPPWDASALVGSTPRWGRPDLLPEWTPEDRALLHECSRSVMARLRALGEHEDRFGLIHADLSFENVLVRSDGSAVTIDFDDCGHGWFLYDLAVALYPFESSPTFPARLSALTRGYGRVADLADDLLDELPTFLMARRLATLGWTHSRGDTAHARGRRHERVATTPAAGRRYLEWAAKA